MSAFTPTEEQEAARTMFGLGGSMVIEAGAGAGKTSTLQLLAQDADKRYLRGRYMAFNKAIVSDVHGRLPQTCSAMTAHAMAFRAVAKPYAHRLQAERMTGWMVAQMLDLDPFVISFGKQRKVLQPARLASHVQGALRRFCQTADEAPTEAHFEYIEGIDLPTDNGKRTYRNNDALAHALMPALAAAWRDVNDTNGKLPFKHEHYLKMWQLSHPRTVADYILFDEAQDANPVMAAVVAEQDHAQRVYVGDANQAIYEFTGAVNSIAEMKASGLATSQLTRSFRFGPAIATAANELLGKLGADLRIVGAGAQSTRGPLEDPLTGADAILTRTNAAALRRLFEAQERGIKAAIVGGGKELRAFAKAAAELQANGRCFHPDLSCFESWGEVLDYVAQDSEGADLAMNVKLVEDFGPGTIIEALEGGTTEKAADVVISTAHKAKGREWHTVAIDPDFAQFAKDGASEAELRLQYVAVTRARGHLDDETLSGLAAKGGYRKAEEQF